MITKNEQIIIDIRKEIYDYVNYTYSNIDLSDIDCETIVLFDFCEASFTHLVNCFNLSEYEAKVLLVAFISEVDHIIPIIYSRLGEKFAPSLSFCMQVYIHMHYTLTTQSSLRKYRLLLFKDETHYVMHSFIYLPENIVHYLLGDSCLDTFIQSSITLVSFTQINHNNSLKKSYSQLEPDHGTIMLKHFDKQECLYAASYLAKQKNLNLYTLNLYELSNEQLKSRDFCKVLCREVFLHQLYLHIECEELLYEKEERYKLLYIFIKDMIEELGFSLCLSANSTLFDKELSFYFINLEDKTISEQVKLWKSLLKNQSFINDDQLFEMSYQFILNSSQSKRIAQVFNQQQFDSKEHAFKTLWQLCKEHLRKSNESSISLVKSTASLKDLILDDKPMKTINQIISHAKNAHIVHEKWGFSTHLNRGKGLVALFKGAPGTGKTTAAEVIANELNLDLLKIDLSLTVSKYIGETEKNLEKAFNIAYTSGAILLFDEADALFSKRTEIKDSHDVHANRQVSFLLQKIEAHRGISILTTNFQNSLDEAFFRRIRFIIEFELPESFERLGMWKNMFLGDIPMDELNYEELSCYALSGAEIKNCALNALFETAKQNVNLNMSFVIQAIKDEFDKNQKPIQMD